MKARLYQVPARFFILIIIFGTSFLHAQSEEPDMRMQWFEEAKLGIFIHWGIYSVNGIDESWSFFNHYISYEDYMKQLDGFTASRYDPDLWVALIKESGARYAVLTSKHHDGVALWPTVQSTLNAEDHAKAGRDLVGPFVKALREQNLQVGLYFSLLDWSHPDYPNFLRDQNRYVDDSLKWNRFVQFNFRQIGELSRRYRPDLFWFDGDWEQTAEKWKARVLRDSLLSWNPEVILNSRLQGYGDYATPEQGLPVLRPKARYWELCMTMNDSWGYQHNDLNYKSVNQIIRIFIDCISMGGNLLLGIGPKADGTIPEEQVNILKGLGRWTEKHAEAIYGTKPGIELGHFYGPTTLSRDKNILYLFVHGKPSGPIVVKGLKNDVHRVWVVGNGTKLSHKVMSKPYWSSIPGLLYIDMPDKVIDQDVTVIAVLLDGEIALYRGEE